jgi:hypothetical protein
VSILWRSWVIRRTLLCRLSRDRKVSVLLFLNQQNVFPLSFDFFFHFSRTSSAINYHSLSLSLWIWISRVPLHKKKFRCRGAWKSPHTHVHTSAYGDKSNVSYLEEKWIFKYCLVVKLNIFNLVIPVSSLLLYCLCTRI